MTKLTKEQFAQTHGALLSAFTDRFQLEKMVRFELGENLNTIAGGNSLDEVTFRLVGWAETQGKLKELVLAAQDANPSNPTLVGLIRELGIDETTSSGPEPTPSQPADSAHRTTAQPKRNSHPPTINHDEPIQLFHQLLNTKTPQRYMRLSGGPEMGKSHLLTRVLPVIAFQKGWRPINLDLRNQATTIIGFMDFLCQTLGRPNFPEYESALQEWTNQPQIQGDTIEDLLAALSADRSKADAEKDEQTQQIEYELTTCIVNDLTKLNHTPLVLIFDQVENADDDVQRWLMEHLLADLKPVEHICVVVGGRALPEPARSYQFVCCSHQLEPVTQPQNYIDYCKELAVELSEQSIRDFATAAKYIPGQFASLVQPFVGASSL
ncbi:MAG: effector-associated domain EAD1-containing protein [Chloroflexota bacterium]